MGSGISSADAVPPAEAAPIKIYGVGGSMNALAVMLYCADKGVKNDLEMTMPGPGTRTEEYLAMFPTHHVPAMMDGDLKITEGSAIIAYLANKHHFFEGLGAYPIDLKARARCDMLSHWRTATFYQAWHKVCYPPFGYLPPQTAEDAAKHKEELTAVMGEFKALLGEGPLLGGDVPNASDYLFIFYFLALPNCPSFTPPEWVASYVAAFKAASQNVENEELVGYFNSMIAKAIEEAGASA
mmetsp:Transcript_16407/g.50226  ORF Transcript_16407/g.50226 Transcript_16407/m.50226 type:complete len:240 (-) Transcript_16407:447-1166(-)